MRCATCWRKRGHDGNPVGSSHRPRGACDATKAASSSHRFNQSAHAARASGASGATNARPSLIMVAVPVATIASAALPVMMRASSSPVRSRMARSASCSKLGAPERIACTKSVSPTQRGAPVGSATASTATDSVTTGDGTLDVSSAATSCTVASWAGVGANRSGPSRSESSSALSSIRRDSRSACECSDTK